MNDTISAIATPHGRGGIGIIRLSGPQAASIALKLCQRDKPFTPRFAHFHHWYDDQGETIDHGLTIYFAGSNAYTGEDTVELQAHGSPMLLKALFERTLMLGCRAAEPGEFTRRAVEHGKIDLSQAEAVVACIDAATLRAAKQAQKQLDGTFGRRISQYMDDLTSVVAHVEACLDFPEDEVPELFYGQLRQRVESELITPIQQQLNSKLGERLFEGATVAIIGEPNVGKSSLLNALSGRDRAIVTDIAGTTRDTLEVDFEVHGIPIRLTDTAGLRQTDDIVEQEGVRRAKQTAETADLVIFIADASRPETWTPETHFENLHIHLKVMNKVDKTKTLDAKDFLPISIKQNQGLETLIEVMATQLGDTDLTDESALVTSSRHRAALEVSLAHIVAGLDMLGREEMIDLTAMEWRRAWSTLGEILGIGDVEFILDKVFSEFCIGK
ncbi:tRNA uridine-5-carboxymethylaminomethyl(34) synthesis GTPase MnmE [Ghiorsea bivora]|uniref:tRNA uridine-5-carboxymethylaminomethyl(34) synthesis GTPase MnmE n=1 Tax=Ghiorsea bivora TaxID=1485545 RepID=UPI00056FE6C4|nr:tRNA uridine-5-carboxymethylaminomethyl(34) synthesis GTPase MnmE [Ghiorsea bivora]